VEKALHPSLGRHAKMLGDLLLKTQEGVQTLAQTDFGRYVLKALLLSEPHMRQALQRLAPLGGTLRYSQTGRKLLDLMRDKSKSR